MNIRWVLRTLLLTIFFVLASCGGDASEQMETDENVTTEEKQQVSEEEVALKHGKNSNNESAKLPSSIKIAENPTFPVGSKVKIYANHMAGMEGAEGTVVGAYDTTAYVISYTPINGGEEVKNYKWVIHEELEGASGAPMEPGRELVINAEHVEGMQSANAVIEAAEEGPVYMVDFTTTTGEEVKNYKWLTEGELAAP
ncbi:MAG: YdhK family protein [Lysinibacillus sp.]|nr:YdhK family protein [Lysinibacillus sp.]